MLLDHSDRWNELPNVVKIAAALSAPTKGLQRFDATETTSWCLIVLTECKKLFQADIAEGVRTGSASNAIRGPGERGADGGEEPREKQKTRGFLTRCVATAKVWTMP